MKRNGDTLDVILRLHDPDGALAYPVTESPGQPASITGANGSACAMLGCTREHLLTLSPDEAIALCNAPANAVHCHVVHLDGQDMNVVIIRDRSATDRRQGEWCLEVLDDMADKFDRGEQELFHYSLEKALDLTGSTAGCIHAMGADGTDMTLKAWIAGDVPGSIFSPPDQCGCDAPGSWAEAARTGNPVIDNHGSNESESPVRLMTLPVRDNGQLVLVATVCGKQRDYDDADKARLSLPVRGVWRVIQRKRAEDCLRLAMKDAERASQAKSQFLANMSHELRTPLNGIMGMTQLLLGMDLSDKQKEYLTLSMEAAQHLSKVMTSLLDLSAIETGDVKVAPVDFNLRETMESVIGPLTIQASRKSITLGHDIRSNVPEHLNGDENKLRQILINLVYNAIKFTEEGQVTLTITKDETRPVPDGTAKIIFTVTDTGVGIPKDKQESIFERFTLGEDYLTKKYGGTGLGLSISRELAQAMDGEIVLQSEPGRGSTFTLTLPFKTVGTAKATCAEPCPSEPGHRPLSVLIAEDEQVNALVTSGILKKHGHSVTVVGNGQHAIDALIATPYDLVLMDVQMPVINGLEVTQIIRSGAAENVPRDIRIIGLTAYATDADHQLCLEAGMDRVVTKPFEADELLDVVRRCAPCQKK